MAVIHVLANRSWWVAKWGKRRGGATAAHRKRKKGGMGRLMAFQERSTGSF